MNFDMSHQRHLEGLKRYLIPTKNESDSAATSHRQALIAFLFSHKPFSAFRSTLQENKKCVDNGTFQCDVGVLVNHSTI